MGWLFSTHTLRVAAASSAATLGLVFAAYVRAKGGPSSETFDAAVVDDKPIDDSHRENDGVPLTERQKKVVELGYPVSHSLVMKENFVALTSFLTKTPLWTLEHLSAETLKGSAQRDGVRFEPAPGIDRKFNAQNNDYWRSGWSRGHMVPASNSVKSAQAMKDSFELSTNIVPQNLDNNMNYWHRLELWVKNLVLQPVSEEKRPLFDEAWVVSGPAWIPHKRSSGGFYQSVANDELQMDSNIRKYHPSVEGEMKFPVIGGGSVFVPTHLFKAIVAKRNQQYFWASFIIPNAHVPANSRLVDFSVSKDELERVTGVMFFPLLKDAPMDSLCSLQSLPTPETADASDDLQDAQRTQSVCSMITPAAHSLFVLSRTLKKCSSAECAAKVLAEEQALRKSDPSFAQLFHANASKSNGAIAARYLELKARFKELLEEA